jgi:hypothetical protein
MNPTLELVIVGFVLLTAALYVGRKVLLRGEPACTASDSCAVCASEHAASPESRAYRATPLVQLHSTSQEPSVVRIPR